MFSYTCITALFHRKRQAVYFHRVASLRRKNTRVGGGRGLQNRTKSPPASPAKGKSDMIPPVPKNEPKDIPSPGFAGLRVLAFESRRAQEMAKLIANYGGRAIVAPS